MTTLQPIVVEYTTAAGVRVHCTPVHHSTHQAIERKAAAEFPYPDKKDFEKPLENAVDPSITIPAEDNPEYIGICETINRLRMDWTHDKLLEVGVSYPDFDSVSAMVDYFRPRLEQLREIADLEEDDTRAVLTHCVYTGTFDKNYVLYAIAQQAPLREGEVLDAMRLFRVDLSKPAFRRVAGERTSRVS